jgi:hypothetical protein
MNSQTVTEAAADEDAIRAIHRRMIDAWNAGDALAFAAPFKDEADFVAFEATHLKGDCPERESPDPEIPGAAERGYGRKNSQRWCPGCSNSFVVEMKDENKE